MIGVYDYTVILTYVSLMISLFGMTLSLDGHYKIAIVCLALSGLCDMFDGKIARTKKNRTEEGKKFGIQIDSLCDVVCFGAFPIIICYSMGIKDVIGLVILMLYGTAGVIRLAYFNVKEEIRQNETTENRKYYQGLPITSASIALPLMYMLRPMFNDTVFLILVRIMMLGIAILFVTDFRFKKPGNKVIAVLVVVVALAIIYMFSGYWLAWRNL
ncbi:MAG: CDP-alcohol phosphatidyltransferase family protein [Lachnospira sp.]|nr:CDP-alcohol phosphatidyltransferase family protein [Lachnospira sp.]MDD5829125.1 CDP-alcohol phosphatidyltransferase family protein [Lachnospira sp.]